MNLLFLIVGAALFYAGFRVGISVVLEVNTSIDCECPEKLEPLPVKKKRKEEEDTEKCNYFYQ